LGHPAARICTAAVVIDDLEFHARR
jgi:hypothetical protein